MSLITALTLAGFSTSAHAESPFINPVSLSDFSEWKLSDKTGSVGSVEMDGSVEVPLYTNETGAPTFKTFITTDATEEGENGDLANLMPGTSLIVVTEDFAKQNDLDIKVTNKRLIPVPEDFKVGGEIKYVNIPSINIGGLVLNDVTALISGSEETINGGPLKGITIGLGSIPTSYAILHSKGVIKFSDDGAGLMNEIGAKGVPYQSTGLIVGTVGKKDLFGSNKTLIPAIPIIVDATFDNSSTKVPVSVMFDGPSILNKHIDVSSDISTHNADIRGDWMSVTIGEITTPEASILRPTVASFKDGIIPSGRIGQDILIGYDIVVDKTSETIGMVEHDGFTSTPYYPIHLEEAYKALEPEEKEVADSESTEEESLNVGGVKALIDALETGGSYSESLKQYAQLLDDDDEKTDCAIWINYGHANRKLGDLDEAHKAYSEASRLYHPWWDIDLGRRMAINKAQGKMEEEEIDAAKERSRGSAINSVEDGWYTSQPESCYRADGWVASVDLLNGNHAAIESNYRNNLDLDARLAMVLGNSALLQGNTELAHEAFRQGIKLENGSDERAELRHALALVYADQGKWDQANALFQESLELLDNPLNAMMWLDNAIVQTDAQSALAMIQEWSKTHPTQSATRIAELRYWTMESAALTAELGSLTSETESEEDEDSTAPVEPTEDSSAQADSVTALTERLETVNASLENKQKAFLEWMVNLDRWKYRDPAGVTSIKILGYTYAGELDKAGDLLQDIQTYESTDIAFSFAAANYYAMTGQTDKASAALAQSAVLEPFLAGSALFLKQ